MQEMDKGDQEEQKAEEMGNRMFEVAKELVMGGTDQN